MKKIEMGVVIALVGLLGSGVYGVTKNITENSTNVESLFRDVTSLDVESNKHVTTDLFNVQLDKISSNIEEVKSSLDEIECASSNIEKISTKINDEIIPAINNVLVGSNKRIVSELELLANVIPVKESENIISSQDDSIAIKDDSVNIKSVFIASSNKIWFIIFIISAFFLLLFLILWIIRRYAENQSGNSKEKILKENENLKEKLKIYKRELQDLTKKQDLNYKRLTQLEEYFKSSNFKNLITGFENVGYSLRESNRSLYFILNSMNKTNSHIQDIFFKKIPLSKEQQSDVLQFENQLTHTIDLLSSDQKVVKNALLYIQEKGDEEFIPILKQCYNTKENSKQISELIEKTEQIVSNKVKK
ncbi:MAG: hypothetical protein GQ564_12180 [Bacteroidales bacterium]|nr:hypothetical protein [Bacteroidales bacterium]